MTEQHKARLVDIWELLPVDQKNQLLEFAEFLHKQHIPHAQEIAESVNIPRPAEESVPKAIKRLAETYPMLNKKMLLDETGTYMTQHLMEGRPAKEVIDDLEAMFRGHYEKLLQDNS